MAKWNIIHEMDDEVTGDATCWSSVINHRKYGKYAWITLESINKYNVEVSDGDDFKTLKSCKSLTSAKRWISVNLL